jgi:hypothetical protein
MICDKNNEAVQRLTVPVTDLGKSLPSDTTVTNNTVTNIEEFSKVSNDVLAVYREQCMTLIAFLNKRRKECSTIELDRCLADLRFKAETVIRLCDSEKTGEGIFPASAAMHYLLCQVSNASNKYRV